MTLRDDIQTAFATNVYPGDDRLTVYDIAGREYDETFQLLHGKTWREMPVAEFLGGDTPLPDLTAESFHYYLPALLIASIDDTADFNADIAGKLMFHLSPTSASVGGEFAFDDVERYEHKMSLLTKCQRDVVIRALEEYVARGWSEKNDITKTIARLRERS